MIVVTVKAEEHTKLKIHSRYLRPQLWTFKEGKDFASSLLGLAFNFNILLFITLQPFAVATGMSAAVVDVDITRLISANARASVMKYILVERRKIQLESN